MTFKKIIKKHNVIYDKIEGYRKERDFEPPKCISDKILLYMRYVLSEIRTIAMKEQRGVSKDEVMMKEIMDRIDHTAHDIYYNRIRGEPEFTNKTPIIVAGVIVYVAARIERCLHLSRYSEVFISFNSIGANILNTSPQSLRSLYIKNCQKLYDSQFYKETIQPEDRIHTNLYNRYVGYNPFV